MNKKIFFTFKIIISSILIYFVLSKANLNDIILSWKNFSILAILFVVFLHFGAVIISTIKWKLFLPQQSFFRLLQFTLIDVFYSMALPGQVSGEILKVYRLGKRTGDIKKVAVSVWMDKITGIIGLLLLMVVGLLFSSISFSIWIYLVIICILIFSMISIYAFNISILSNFLQKYLHIKFIGDILKSIIEFKKNHLVIIINIILGTIYQLLSIFIIMIFSKELSIDISIIEWFWIFGLVSIIQFVPISIAGLGVREVSFIGLLSIFAVGTNNAIVISLSIFALQAFFACVGFMFEVQYHLSRR